MAEPIRPGIGKKREQSTGLPDPFVMRFCDSFNAAKKHQDAVASIVDELYEFCLPLRERPFGAKTASARRTDRLFDSTAASALADFASQRIEDVWPTDQKPIDLLPGRNVPDKDKEDLRAALSDIANLMIEEVNNSNFRESAVEAALDYGISTGILLVEEGTGIETLNHRAIPFTDAVLSLGTNGEHDALYRRHFVKAEQLKSLWPDGNFSDLDLHDAEQNPKKESEIVEGYFRDWTRPKEEIWVYAAVQMRDKRLIKRSEVRGVGSKPFVSFSFMRVPNEVWGRGPAQLALPDVRSLNVLQELILEHLDISVGGLWSYEDMGTVNVDTIQIRPGTIYPRMRGTLGLQPINPGGNPQFGAIERDRLERKIEQVFFKLELGALEKTPRSAAEILQRVADRAGRLSGPNSRIVKELLFPYVRRVLYILRNKGLIAIPRLDRSFMSIRPLSPITRSQAQDDILRHVRWAEFVNQIAGPQVANLVIDQEALAVYLGERMGVEPRTIRTALARQQLAATIAQLSAAASQSGTAQ